MPEAAILETTVATTPVGDIFKDALARSQAGESEESIIKSVHGKPAVIPKAEPKLPVAKAVKAAPKSALDAALETGEVVTKEPDIVEEDPLKEFPESGKEANWKKARELIGKQHTELKELRTKASKPPEPDPTALSQLEELRTQLKARDLTLAERESKLAEYNDAMTAVNIELHPDFRKEFIEGRKQLVQTVSAKLKNYGGNPEAVTEALALPEGKRRDTAIEEALEGLGETARAKIQRSIADIEALDERRDKAMGNPQEAYEKLERNTIAQRQKTAHEAEQLKSAEFERITRDLHKTVPMLSLVDEAMEGGKEWNGAVKSAREGALKLLSQDATFPQIVTAAVKGMDYDRVTSMLISERKEVAALRAQLAEYDGAAPDLKGNKAPKKGEDKEYKAPGKVFTEVMAKFGGGQDF